jgi:hypothetical protein
VLVQFSGVEAVLSCAKQYFDAPEVYLKLGLRRDHHFNGAMSLRNLCSNQNTRVSVSESGGLEVLLVDGPFVLAVVRWKRAFSDVTYCGSNKTGDEIHGHGIHSALLTFEIFGPALRVVI